VLHTACIVGRGRPIFLYAKHDNMLCKFGLITAQASDGLCLPIGGFNQSSTFTRQGKASHNNDCFQDEFTNKAQTCNYI
jgi:hypothetical protein